MTRATAIRRSFAGALLALLCAAVFTAVALAAKPAHGAKFSGRTAAEAVEGFFAPVNFTVSRDGKSLKGFTFGSLGCEGAGGFAPGVSPYKGGSIIHVGTVKVSSKGAISVSGAKSKFEIQGQITTTTVAITGHFTKRKAATGTITFSQKFSGTLDSGCGPAKINFTASAH
ncbi:MAG TPA: hypothetical protein VH061_02020 [Solirubrobacteraceae bacterium]|jgi:hypothetical protein|nr:hypothetical protein [Solirubrobacteraceae bacterium]